LKSRLSIDPSLRIWGRGGNYLPLRAYARTMKKMTLKSQKQAVTIKEIKIKALESEREGKLL
jgi:hypothetical protein